MIDVLGGTKRLTAALEQGGYAYVIGGALALSYWALPRATVDIDITIDVEPINLPELLRVLREAGCEVDEERAIRAAERGDFCARIDGVRIDVFLVGSDLVDEALQRRVRVPFAGSHVWIMSAEDVLLLKTLFGRTKDFADMERLLAACGATLDWPYVDRWIATLFPVDDERRKRLEALRKV